MYRCFKITPLNFSSQDVIEKFYNIGFTSLNKNKAEIKKTLDNFISSDNTIDGEDIRNKWFPLIDTHIFISHSRKNETEAIILAGWLNDNFQLNTFIDSSVWGYADDLLREIDELYYQDKNTGLFDYKSRNYSTSNVHMLLSTALAMMIDKTECLFFLDTPNSININKNLKEFNSNSDKTRSPWIYFENIITGLKGKTIPERFLKKAIIEELYSHADGLSKGLEINYPLDFKNYKEINFKVRNNWKDKYNRIKEKNPLSSLDMLYEILPE